MLNKDSPKQERMCRGWHDVSTKPPPAANGCPTVRFSRFKLAFNPCLN